MSGGSRKGKQTKRRRDRQREKHQRDVAELARRYAVMEGQAETCGKRRYATKGAALYAVGLTANHPLNPTGINGTDGLHRLSVYRCPTCDGRPWHVGHTPGQKR